MIHKLSKCIYIFYPDTGILSFRKKSFNLNIYTENTLLYKCLKVNKGFMAYINPKSMQDVYNRSVLI